MSENELQVEARDVEIGMYVNRLDRPWLETPFMLQGFMIHDAADLKMLVDNCEYCYVNIQLSRSLKPLKRIKEKAVSQNIKFGKRSKNAPIGATTFTRRRTHQDHSEMRDELKDVRRTHATMGSAVKDMMRSLKFHKKLDLSAIKTALKPMVDSIIRNPDALLWLNRLRRLDDYNYSHALGCSIWAMAMGRQLGFNKGDIEALGLGGLLIDIGKTRLPEKLLTKKYKLTESEVELLKTHVQHSLDILESEDQINFKVKNMIESHHERTDGSGYPNGLDNNQIPLFGKIAAIVDCYDAITSERSYAQPLSSQEAVKKLYEWRGKDFQAELVEEFIQAIGMFPSGTLIELSSGEVAVVVTESRLRRLRPKIMLLLNADKSVRDDYVMCDMSAVTYDDKGKKLEILHALPAGSYDIQADEYFL